MRRAETVEAVSSVFFFQDQIFVVVRQNHLEAFPGYHAFPGGKIDSQDHSSNSSSNFPELNPVHLSALHREMKEELDFDLQKELMMARFHRSNRLPKLLLLLLPRSVSGTGFTESI